MNVCRKEVRVWDCGVGGWDAPHIEIGVLMQFNPSSRLCHGVPDVVVSFDRNSLQLLRFTPLKEGKILDVHMASALGRGLSFDRKNSPRIIDQQIGRCVYG